MKNAHHATWMLLGLILMGGVGACWRRPPPPSSRESTPLTSVPLPSSLPIPGIPPATASVVLPGGLTAPMSFAALVKASDPAVVTVFTVIDERRMGKRMRRGEGLGSGFLYDPSGYILTNNHVIAQATEIIVRLADERRLPAKVVGRDPPTDVAILKVDVTGAPALPLGDSNATEVGDWVVAIGNPFGLSHTVSAGILSARGRTRDDVQDLDRTGRGYFNFLQTDAAINQGNSGGPLLNLRGEVVGINTAIRANANNIGFAIPINMVKQLIPMLIRDGKVRRSALGITVGGLSEEDMVRLRRADRKGALVRGVQPGGAAARAGIAEDDVILAFNGVAIPDPEELRWQASIAGIGSTASVKIARGDRIFEVHVILGALPEAPEEPPSIP
ncbi:MAG: trypsin-like peptidase domain-containing protein [Myxococcales bacterium]|nr:trypsin-like peptidase domain-containing protein [Polyangiaceae bacterium]MDW8248407.1 trypsin-like peptidase domain-containing protein [Myxococcales bacterium]